MNKQKKLVQLILFAMYGAMMFISKIIMEGLPNIHPLTMFVMTFTVVYGIKALIPIYIYVFLNGLYSGFNMWWIPYLYIWSFQCLVTLILPKRMNTLTSYIVYPLTAAFFGITFGTLYSPAQALMFHFTPDMTLKWILSGLPFDVLHAVGNFAMGLLVLPMSQLLKRLHASSRIPI